MLHLKAGVRTEVGHGKTTKFWFHNWVDTTLLCKRTLQNITPTSQDCTIDELWDAHSGWKWNLFANLLPSEFVKKIAGYEVGLGEGKDDQLLWSGASQGGFSLKRDVAIIRRDICVETDHVWPLIWAAPLPQRI